MSPKPWWRSKTVWTCVGIIAYAATQALAGIPNLPWWATMALGFAMFVLRSTTTQAITFGNNTPPAVPIAPEHDRN